MNENESRLISVCKSTVSAILRLASHDDGVTAIEYALLGSLIAVAIVGSVAALGTSVSGLYNTIAAAVAGAI